MDPTPILAALTERLVGLGMPVQSTATGLLIPAPEATTVLQLQLVDDSALRLCVDFGPLPDQEGVDWCAQLLRANLYSQAAG